MGVRRLWKYLCTTEVRFKTLRLSETPKKVLVCDLIAVLYWLIELLHTAKVSSKTDEGYSVYTAIYGGDFNDYRERLLGFIRALRHIGIQPIFFFDGPSFGPEEDMKNPTRVARLKRNLDTLKTYAKICNYDPRTEMKYEKRIKKIMLFRELIYALKSVGVELVFCSGEADQVMAQYARDHRDEVCGILTNDTDLIIMSNVPAMRYKFFDSTNALKLNSTEMEEHPREIHCKILTSKIVSQHLGIDERCLPAFAILCGNDFTGDINEVTENFRETFSYPIPKTVANFVKHHEQQCMRSDTFLELREVKQLFLETATPDAADYYRRVVEYSYHFYQSPPVVPPEYYTVNPTIRAEVESGKLDKFVLSVLSGKCFMSEIEQLDDDQPCVSKATRPVRQQMYALLQCNSVVEHGQYKLEYYETLVEVRVPYDWSVLESLRAMTDMQKLFVCFHLLCDQQIPSDMTSEIPADFDLPINTAMVCSAILFARKFKFVPDVYVQPLVLACISCALGMKAPPTTARPGPKGVTIAAQFMTLLQHEHLLASLLSFSGPFPLPSTQFQPFVYMPLHDTAFKISEKVRFHGEKLVALKHYYDSLSKRPVLNLVRLVCDESINRRKFIRIVTEFNSVLETMKTMSLEPLPHPNPGKNKSKKK